MRKNYELLSSKRQSEWNEELRRVTKLRTLADMSEAEIRELERQFGCPVARPAASRKKARRAVVAASK